MASKGGKTKLGHSKFFTEGAEVSFDGNVTVAEFEKEATSKTGMEVTIYYETKAEGKRSKYYQANLEERVSEMDNIASQKEYMDKLVNVKSIDEVESNVDEGEAVLKQNIGSTIKWSVGYIDEEEDFDEINNNYVPAIIKMIEENYALISIEMFIAESETPIAYTTDIDKEQYKDEGGGFFIDEGDYLLIFKIADNKIWNSAKEFRQTFMDSDYWNEYDMSGFFVEVLDSERKTVDEFKYGYDNEDMEYYIYR